jgi:hypothetical protein
MTNKEVMINPNKNYWNSEIKIIIKQARGRKY